LPEAWTQSSQFFTGIEVAIIHNYLADLRERPVVREELAEAYHGMERSLEDLEGFPGLLDTLQGFLKDQWPEITSSADPGKLYSGVQDLFGRLRADARFPILRRAVETISEFVRAASGFIVVSEFLEAGRYQPGDVRQAFYRDLTCRSDIKTAASWEPRRSASDKNRTWLSFGKDEIRETLSMYGKNFLFLDRAVIEVGDIRDGLIGFGSYTVPTPEENPILKDHFVGLPLFGGHLQMEAVAQLGTFMVLKLQKEKRLVPILTGTEFPDLNTMAPPGEKLAMMGTIRLQGKRLLACEAFIENRFARSRGTVRGMVIPERLFRKTMTSFSSDDDD
jgi:3-hydroxymyristoyl/3-hydroxydecanoyl-(acyl carrier protein) dehydratase